MSSLCLCDICLLPAGPGACAQRVAWRPTTIHGIQNGHSKWTITEKGKDLKADQENVFLISVF